MQQGFHLFVEDPFKPNSRPVEARWPEGCPVPTSGDFFVWQGETRWVDDVTWEHRVDPIGTPTVHYTIQLGYEPDDEDFEDWE